jgi:membrane dipeptidase
MIFDGHNDTLTRLYREGCGARSFFEAGSIGHLDLPRAKRGGLAGGLFAIQTRPPPGSPELNPWHGFSSTPDGYSVTERSPIDPGYAQAFSDSVLAFAGQLQTEGHGEVRIAKTGSELEQCLDEGVFAMVLHLEGAEAIRTDLANLSDYYRRGVRSLGLVWSRTNVFGHGVPFRFPHSPDTGPGLTDAGVALVRACNQLGILIDLAHLNERGFWQVARLSSAPLVVTHADVWAICPSTRNLTDAQIKAVGESGGVIGINFETVNTHPRSDPDPNAPLTQITAHIDHIADCVGVDHVAFGSDFDGADMPNALGDVSGLPRLIEVLRSRGYDQASIDKIAYGNWLRVLGSTWKA